MTIIELGRTLHSKLADAVPQARTKSNAPKTFQPRSIIVLRKGPNPTFAYYLEERLSRYEKEIPVFVRSIDTDVLDDLDTTGAFVIICRYLRPAQITWLHQNSKKLCGIGLLVDDDVAAVITGTEAPLSYRLKLILSHVIPIFRLRRMIDIIWASTPPLAALLAANNSAVSLLPPLPRKEDIADDKPGSARPNELRIGYYATGIHINEHRFLASFIPELLSQHPQVTFEVAADDRVSKLWRRYIAACPRIRLLPIMPWPHFAQSSRGPQVDIALVPLLSGRVNNSRADTKRIDVCRQGAAAVFSRVGTYSRNHSPGEVLAENDSVSWKAAIESLINSKTAREEARCATRAAVLKLHAEADLSIPGLRLSKSLRPDSSQDIAVSSRLLN